MKPMITLAAVDLSPASEVVVDRALRLAADHPQAEVHVVAVREPGLGGVAAGELRDLVAPLRHVALQRVGEFEHGRPAHSVDRVVVHALDGQVALEIVGLGAHLGADTIVVGAHGRGGQRGSALGSVSSCVVRLAGCPVLVVRATEHGEALRSTTSCEGCADARAAPLGGRLRCAEHAGLHVDAQVHAYASGAPWKSGEIR
jgi:nucleotide-binding universal stress UspA family protein